MSTRRIVYSAQVMSWPGYDRSQGSYGNPGPVFQAQQFVPYGFVGAILAAAGTVAGPIVGSIQAKQEEKKADACGTAAQFKNKYTACATARRAKGKAVYPGNPGKGPFFTDCREDYKKWQKYKGLCESASAGMETEMLVEEEEGANPFLLLGGGLLLIGLIGGGVYLATQPERKEVA
jgi:hypothetical protein